MFWQDFVKEKNNNNNNNKKKKNLEFIVKQEVSVRMWQTHRHRDLKKIAR